MPTRSGRSTVPRRDNVDTVTASQSTADVPRRHRHNQGDALAVIVATAVAGITFGLWRKLMQQRSTIQEKEDKLEHVTRKLEETKQTLVDVQHKLLNHVSELQLTKSQMEMLRVELRQTKEQLIQARHDVNSKHYQIRALQTGADFDEYY